MNNYMIILNNYYGIEAADNNAVTNYFLFNQKRNAMKKSLPALLLATLSVASFQASAADEPKSPHSITGNVGLYSQYVYRGLTQTNQKPALQGGFDYAHSNGFYAGNWNSNVSWIADGAQNANEIAQASVVGPVSASLESDFYGGYKANINDDIPYDVGVLRYQYWGSYPSGFTKPDTTEIYGSIGYKWVTAKYSYSLGDTFGIPDSKGSDYMELNASVPAGKWTIAAHVGKQRFKLASTDGNYIDYKLGGTYDIGDGYTLGLAGTNSNAKDSVYTLLGKNIGKAQFILNIGKTF
jgi:uncharacterized protein (TIGR02001 family)